MVAVLTLPVITPRDHTSAVAHPDILEMGEFAKVKCFIQLSLIGYESRKVSFR